ncbi:hypothetical protein AAFC00_006005 [Neodothiora populina]|uniref:Kinesin motor domain-containing protein n=1 Tax=Neodothiora populina TaxID=2781224 RepID=A0ABR3P6M1_9PEZI
MAMDPPKKPTTSLFDVYLRLRPPFAPNAERFLEVEEKDDGTKTHITIRPPESEKARKRAIEKFAFTKVFEEEESQLDLFHGIGLGSIVEGVLGQEGREGRDGLLATLGVTGSGKSHTILGSRSQRGLTQLSLDVLYQNLDDQLVQTSHDDSVFTSLCNDDNSEAQMLAASTFLESMYGDGETRGYSRGGSRAGTPLMDISCISGARPSTANGRPNTATGTRPSTVAGGRRYLPRLSNLPQYPLVEDIAVNVDPTAEYAIVISMYEVYNDRIFDLLTCTATKNPKDKRRALLYKPTEASPDRKVVAGLKKVICGNLDEALLVLETGLTERRVAGTGSNATSSRSHGFFCIEVKKRHCGEAVGPWSSSALTVVDLAGSERARNAKTAGATLAEAGKINESLMYLGQCMQLQSDNSTDSSRPQNIVPYRQCKLTELLFSNSYPSTNPRGGESQSKKAPQKAIMIVTADPLGDYNATSQILRYSALAREVTVPRIPSLTSTMIHGVPTLPRPGTAMSGRSTPTLRVNEIEQELQAALQQISLLREELEMQQMRLEEETTRRRRAEASWETAESRLDTLEFEVREEVWSEMEERLAQEQRRWRAARDADRENDEAYVDRKLDILTRGMEEEDLHVVPEEEEEDENGENVNIYEDEEPSILQHAEALEEENAALREKIARLEAEKEKARSPSKKLRVLKQRRWEGSQVGLDGSP